MHGEVLGIGCADGSKVHTKLEEVMNWQRNRQETQKDRGITLEP